MGNWYKVTLAFADCGIGGKGQALQDAFAALFVANGGPVNAALFTNHDEDFQSCFYYFSSGAVQIAKHLIAQHAGVPCSAPTKDRVILVVGHAGIADTLLPALDNS